LALLGSAVSGSPTGEISAAIFIVGGALGTILSAIGGMLAGWIAREDARLECGRCGGRLDSVRQVCQHCGAKIDASAKAGSTGPIEPEWEKLAGADRRR